MFSKTAKYYDLIYSWRNKDYAKEVKILHEIIQEQVGAEGITLLDVACGTGTHLSHLQHHYQVEGLDLDGELLRIARRKLPGIPLHHLDMADFQLGRQFNVVLCLFSSIGYVETVPRLMSTLKTFADHTLSGGLVIVEPWLSSQQFKPDTVHAVFVDEVDLKICRLNTSAVEGDLSIMDFHYLIGTHGGVEYMVENHTLAMFSHNQYLEAFNAAGLTTHHDEEGLTGRGLYIGVKP